MNPPSLSTRFSALLLAVSFWAVEISTNLTTTTERSDVNVSWGYAMNALAYTGLGWTMAWVWFSGRKRKGGKHGKG
jgi:hypothetical protein